MRYNSCRHRSCPQCGGGRRAQWLQELSSQLLPCDHVHVIFTVPDSLNKLWQFNRTAFADLLLQAARESLQRLLGDPKYLGATPGIISALHTWGRNLSIHPHVHCLVTAAGVDRSGNLVHSQRNALLPAKVLMAVFRGKLCARLKAALDDRELSVPVGMTEARLRSMLNRLGRNVWNVRVQERYRHGVSVAGYIARYITGGPISDQRLHSVSDSQIVFRYRDYRDGEDHLMKSAPHEFLALWSEHIPPRGLRMIRRCGLYANRHASTRQRIHGEFVKTKFHTAQTVTELEPESCPRCNTHVVRRDLQPIAQARQPGRLKPGYSVPIQPP